MGLDNIQKGSITGLQTFVFSCPDTNNYTVNCTLTLPTAQSLGTNVASGVVTTIKHNSTTIYTSQPGDKGLQVAVGATAGDTLSVILSSSVAQDQVINAVRCTVGIWEGESI